MRKCKKNVSRDKIAVMMALASCCHTRKGKRQESRLYYSIYCDGYQLTKQS